MTRLSDYFTLEEMTISQMAGRRGLDNIPTGAALDALERTARRLDAVRELLGSPILVSSGYRSTALNTLIGGSATSSHVRGEAVDFICPGVGSVKRVFDIIRRSAIKFDQLILEHPESNGGWVHIGFGPKARCECLVKNQHGYSEVA